MDSLFPSGEGQIFSTVHQGKRGAHVRRTARDLRGDCEGLNSEKERYIFFKRTVMKMKETEEER